MSTEKRHSGGECGRAIASGSCHAMDAIGHAVVVGTSDRRFHVFDVRKLAEPVGAPRGPVFDRQTSGIAILADGANVVASSIEGRAHLMPLNAASTGGYGFRCHRVPAAPPRPEQAHSVNGVAACPTVPAVLATFGSDGRLSIWDSVRRICLAQLSPEVKNSHESNSAGFATPLVPITAAAWDWSGQLMAIASGDDWSRGAHHHDAAARGESIPPTISITILQPNHHHLAAQS
jgi:hypothetical protein